MPEFDDVSILLSARAGVYRTLQNIFGNEPTEKMLEQLSGNVVKGVCAIFDSEDGAFGQAATRLFAAAEECLAGGSEAMDALEGRFTRLFVGPGATEGNPWESYHLSKDQTLRQEVTLDVRRAYVQQELIPQSYPKVADDSIALELDFLAKLAERSLQDWTAGNSQAAREALRASDEFLKEHLSKWAPLFAKGVINAKHGSLLYAEASSMLVSFIGLDFQVVEELLEAMK